jgi:hypothetical protein
MEIIIYYDKTEKNTQTVVNCETVTIFNLKDVFLA